MTCGIYEIVNLITGQRYIGHSKEIEYRFYSHRLYLGYGTHHNPHLQASWNKYGKDSFEFSILEVCPEDQLLIREQDYLDHHWGFLFNLARKADKPPGVKGWTEDSHRSSSISHSGRTQSVETRKKRSRSMQGRIPGEKSAEAKSRLADSNRRRVWTDELRNKHNITKRFREACRRIAGIIEVASSHRG